MSIVTSKDGQALDLNDVTECHLLEEKWDFPHIGWFILWTILFFPIGAIGPLIVGLMRHNYTCAIKFKRSKRIYTFNKKNYRLLQLHDGGFDD